MNKQMLCRLDTMRDARNGCTLRSLCPISRFVASQTLECLQAGRSGQAFETVFHASQIGMACHDACPVVDAALDVLTAIPIRALVHDSARRESDEAVAAFG